MPALLTRRRQIRFSKDRPLVRVIQLVADTLRSEFFEETRKRNSERRLKLVECIQTPLEVILIYETFTAPWKEFYREVENDSL